MLDEIDKMSMDFRGDPSAALLEVLDPEQNYMFMDHYLDVEYDLSQVFFIATANVLHTIPPALQDRMEVIRLSGYTELEKLEIAKRFLVPKQMKQTGLKSRRSGIHRRRLAKLDPALHARSGRRNLEREIGNVCRKVARKVVNAHSSGKAADSKKIEKAVLNAETVTEFLGPAKFRDLQADKKNEVGATVGLAWTEVGGSILTTEAAIMEGRGKLQTTGKLGDVMQESAQAAMSYVRSRAHLLGLPRDFYRNVDIHVHVPEGAIPKDGPSAGITIATSICSALTNIPVRCDLAMTGEITVRGRVLPIGGLKEKVAGGAPARNPRSGAAEGQRKRSSRYSGEHPQRDEAPLRDLHGRSAEDCAGAGNRGAAARGHHAAPVELVRGGTEKNGFRIGWIESADWMDFAASGGKRAGWTPSL